MLLIGCAVGAPRAWAQAPRSVASLEIPPGRRQLFLDDYAVDKLENLTRTLHQPDKKGAVITPERPWEKHSLQT